MLYAWRSSSDSCLVLYRAMLCYVMLWDQRWLQGMTRTEDVVLDGIGYIECMERSKMQVNIFEILNMSSHVIELKVTIFQIYMIIKRMQTFRPHVVRPIRQASLIHPSFCLASHNVLS